MTEEDSANLLYLMSEKVLARDWDREEEEAAWSHLQVPISDLTDEEST